MSEEDDGGNEGKFADAHLRSAHTPVVKVNGNLCEIDGELSKARLEGCHSLLWVKFSLFLGRAEISEMIFLGRVSH